MPEFEVVRPLRDPSARTLPTGTVTFLLADIEGSLRLWESDRRSMGDALARLQGLVDAAVDKNNGVRPLEQGEGDSFVAAFAGAGDAVGCALDLQLALAREPWPGDITLRARMALHTGEAQLRDEHNYMGTAISRCGRLRSLAHGGQTLVSPTTYELVADRLSDGVALRDLGVQHLRDVPRPLRVYQLVHPDLDEVFPPLRSLEVLTRHLPRHLTTFIGRQPELAEIEALLGTTRLVTLTGAGGCGKTRLAVRAAELTADSFPDGIWFADLSTVEGGTGVPAAVAAAVQRVEEPGRTALDSILDQLESRRALLVLDNCEHVVDACADLVDALLRACPSLTILSTSREPLRVEGEACWRVPSMRTPADGDAASLTTYDAVRLFIDRAVRARPNFSITNDNAPAVASICQHLDGIPLAIELAAARTRVLTPDQIAAGLTDRFRLLRGNSRTAGPRQQTLLASVQWSHDLLTEEERAVLRRLSVFAGGFTLDAAEHVAGAGDIAAVDVLDLLSGLVDKSLVAAGEEGPDGRYRLLETVRQFAAERLDVAGEVDATRERHARFFVAFAERAAPEILNGDQLPWVHKLEADVENLRAALTWLIDAGDGPGAYRLVVALGMFWNIRGYWAEAAHCTGRTLALEPDLPFLADVVEFLDAGFRSMLGDVESAIPVMERLAAAEGSGDGLRAWALNQLGKYEAWRNLPRGRAHLEASREASRRARDTSVLADTLSFAAWLDLAMGRTAAAVELLDEVRQASSTVGDTRGLAIALLPRATAAMRMADLGLAQRALDECMELSSALDDRFTLATALLLAGDVAALTGQYTHAADLLAEGVQLGKETGSPFLSAAESFLARLAFAQGDPGRACEIWERTVRRLNPLGTWLFVLIPGAYEVAEWRLAAGDERGAEAAIAEGVAAADDSGNSIAGAVVRLSRARLGARRREVAAAEADAHDALAVFAGASATLDVAAALGVLATLAAQSESWVEAARLLGAADAAFAAAGAVRPRPHQQDCDALRATLEDELLPAALETAFADGAAMSLDAAVAYARRGRGERKRPSSGWESLTPAELDVVRLVAGGATNRDVAERLFISVNTVKVHLSHVFAKLGVRTRTELATAAVQRGIR